MKYYILELSEKFRVMALGYGVLQKTKCWYRSKFLCNRGKNTFDTESPDIHPLG
jgi:hypothetical protein